MRRLPSHIQEVFEGIFLIRVPQPYYSHANVYLLKENETFTLIDAGHPSSSHILIKALHRLGCSPGHLSQIVYTHTHVDHFGGGLGLGSYPGASHLVFKEAVRELQDYRSFIAKIRENITHRTESFLVSFQRALTEDDAGWAHAQRKNGKGPAGIFTRKNLNDYCRKYFPEVSKVPKLVPIEEGESIRAGRYNLKVVFTPGHSPYDICLYESKEQILFGGDVVVGRSAALRDVNVYMRSLQKLLGVKCALLFPGHGPVRENPRKYLLSAVKDVVQKEKALYKILRGEPKTLPEILFRAHKSVPRTIVEYLSAARWIMAFLEKFEREGRVIWEEKEGIVYYSIR